MLVRALIVVLLAMNLGVALWWAFRPPVPEYQVPRSDAGGVELEVLPADTARGETPAAPPDAASVACTPAGQAPADPDAPAPPCPER